MTKKDYIIIADALKSVHQGYDLTSHTPQELFTTIITVLSYVMGKDNPRFDKKRFQEFIFSPIGDRNLIKK